MARGMSPFVEMVLGEWLPEWLFRFGESNYNLFSVIFLIVCTIISNSGTEKIGTFNSVLNVIKIIIFFLIIIMALSNFDSKNISPIIP
jgi:amino acid transporter